MSLLSDAFPISKSAVGIINATGIIVSFALLPVFAMTPPGYPHDAIAHVQSKRPEFGNAKSTYAGSASCRECHSEAYALWAKSNHGLAERAASAKLDQMAFMPAHSLQSGSQITSIGFTNGTFLISEIGRAHV